MNSKLFNKSQMWQEFLWVKEAADSHATRCSIYYGNKTRRTTNAVATLNLIHKSSPHVLSLHSQIGQSLLLSRVVKGFHQSWQVCFKSDTLVITKSLSERVGSVAPGRLMRAHQDFTRWLRCRTVSELAALLLLKEKEAHPDPSLFLYSGIPARPCGWPG